MVVLVVVAAVVVVEAPVLPPKALSASWVTSVSSLSGIRVDGRAASLYTVDEFEVPKSSARDDGSLFSLLPRQFDADMAEITTFGAQVG